MHNPAISAFSVERQVYKYEESVCVGGGYCGIVFAITILVIHFALLLQILNCSSAEGDDIFTYTLSNNPYSFDFIDYTYPKFPQSNGWINAHILRESYVVEDYDAFNYSSVYFHQRLDTHPPFYYFLVHTVCSIFKNTYSKVYPMFINCLFMFMIDILLIKVSWKIYGKAYYALVPFICLFLIVVLLKVYILMRMYLMLSFFCFWYLYIHWNLLSNKVWRKSYLLQMIFCILCGSQTHYYFYVYACSLTVFAMIYFVLEKRIYELWNYVYSAMIGIALSWIFFPWVVWHIFFNQMGKHTNIEPWSLQKLKGYIVFLDAQLFNGRGFLAVLVIGVFYIIGKCIKKETGQQKTKILLFRRLTFASGFVYSLIIYTLDGDNWYYMTPLYLTFILWISMLLIDTIKRSAVCKQGWLVIGLASMAAVGIFSVSKSIGFIEERLRYVHVKDDFSKIAVEYQGYDCIFVERRQNNLFQNYWFEFGDYDEFKKIALSDYEQYGIHPEELAGRKDDSGLILYAPLGCGNGQEGQLLVDDGDYGIYKVE